MQLCGECITLIKGCPIWSAVWTRQLGCLPQASVGSVCIAVVASHPASGRPPSPLPRRDRHPPAVHHRRPHGLLHALRLADGGAATAALLQLLCWCRMLLLLALHLSCSGRSAVSGLICLNFTPHPASPLPCFCASPSPTRSQLLNDDRLPAYQHYHSPCLNVCICLQHIGAERRPPAGVPVQPGRSQGCPRTQGGGPARLPVPGQRVRAAACRHGLALLFPGTLRGADRACASQFLANGCG